ncbi:transposase pseudogene [Sorangium cellulosum So ce56]|nr:hypothetical protein [Sorangium cellulosum]CAN96306.1 transposase pseudogene [Sorangium cellulosum So ce56]
MHKTLKAKATSPSADDVWELYYGLVLLAQVTLKNKELKLARAR